MSFEQSNGKARPTLPRASDLRTVKTERKPTDGRTADGRFAPGNRASIGAGFARVAKKLLGPHAPTNDDEQIVRRDAWRIFVATMRSMPSDAPPVRTLVGLHARHASLAALYGALAAQAGHGTPEGMKLQEAADRQSQRAERVLVTALDAARVCAETAEATAPRPWLMPPAKENGR
jgi:hypothetical protein